MNGGVHQQKFSFDNFVTSDARGPWPRDSNFAKRADYHCHQEKEMGINKRARRKLIIASLLCAFFMVAEIAGGYLSNSLAITTDAAHLLTDLASFTISLFSLQMSGRQPSRKMNYGWYRSEVLGAMTSVLMIWVVTAFLVYLAILRIITQEYEIDAEVMLITSGTGVIVNLIMGLTLQQPNASNISGENINVRAAFIHVVGDFLQSFGVFTASLTIFFKRDWLIIDPICTFIFSVIVIATTVTIMKETIMVLMEGTPSSVDFEDVMNTLLLTENIRKVHNIRIWALSLDKIAMTAHIVIDPSCDPRTVLSAATKNLRAKYKFFEMTLQVEDIQAIMDDCNHCKNPKY